MNKCELCGEPSQLKFCQSCVERVQKGCRPCICSGCRKTFGPGHSLTWLNAAGLEPLLLTHMMGIENGGENVSFFVRQSCDDCEDIDQLLSQQLFPQVRAKTVCSDWS